jgi:hypothetical protein
VDWWDMRTATVAMSRWTPREDPGKPLTTTQNNEPLTTYSEMQHGLILILMSQIVMVCISSSSSHV